MTFGWHSNTQWNNLVNMGAFQQIATSNERHVFLAMTLRNYTKLFLFQQVIYCHFVIKSVDLEGWRKKILLPFPKGWSRVVATRRHLSEGAAGKTILHWLNARREASIRRSQCSNSEAIVGGWVEAHTKVFGSLRRVCNKLYAPFLFIANGLAYFHK